MDITSRWDIEYENRKQEELIEDSYGVGEEIMDWLDIMELSKGGGIDENSTGNSTRNIRE